MDTVRLPKDSNGNPVPVAALDFAARLRVDVGGGGDASVAVTLERGLYRIQSVGVPVWLSQDASPTDSYVLFPGDDGISYFSEGSEVTFTADAETFGAGAAVILLIPAMEV